MEVGVALVTHGEEHRHVMSVFMTFEESMEHKYKEEV